MSVVRMVARGWPGLVVAGLAAAVLMTLCLGPAVAAGPQIGMVKTVAGDAALLRGGSKLAVKVGDPVFEKDTVETGPNGTIGITFIDNTVLSAGPNSRLSLEDYKFDSSNFKGSMLADMRQGTLAVVSGDIARSSPDAMKIRTPEAMLAVRGTRFVVEVGGGH